MPINFEVFAGLKSFFHTAQQIRQHHFLRLDGLPPDVMHKCFE